MKYGRLAEQSHGNIVLIGRPCSGKSTVAPVLAEFTSKVLVDTDILIAKKADMPIAGIIEEHGMEYFHSFESRIVKEVSNRSNQVIATGGGMVMLAANSIALSRNGTMVWLAGEPSTLVARWKADPNRPLITSETSLLDETVSLLRRCQDTYQWAADITVNTDNRSPKEISNEILYKLGYLTAKLDQSQVRSPAANYQTSSGHVDI